MKLAVIPARGGSKRVPRKNIRSFCGEPMIARSIEAALTSGCFDQVLVSTDDPEIAEVAKAYGASVPFMRPSALADEFTPTIPVIRHAIEWWEAHEELPSQVCCIYATAPFIRPSDLQKGLALLMETGCDYTFSVTTYPFPIQRAIRITKDNRVAMFSPELFCTRSQDLEESYHDAGQFYWGQVSAWLDEKPLFATGSVPVLLPRHRVQDIDSNEDWVRAELMYKALEAESEGKDI